MTMIRKSFYITLLSFVASLTMIGQVNHTLYFMERIPQSNQINPALQPNCNLYIGVPGLSSMYFDMGNNSLSVSSIVQYNQQLDSLVTFLHPLADRNKFFDALQEDNYFYNAFQYDIISFGFRIQSLYFHFNTALKSYTYFTYPKSFMQLIINGSDIGAITNLKTFGINNTTYGEMSFGLSNKFDDDLTIGAKIKLLSGLTNISTLNKQFLVETFEDQESKIVNRIMADVSFRGYMPYLEETPNGSEVSVDSIFKLKDKPQKAIKPFESMGLGFDIGVIYSGFENILLSASVVDLGYIRWGKNAYDYKMRSSYTLSGATINKDSLEDAFKNPIGSINDSIKFSKSSIKYTTALPTKIYLGGEYFLETYFSFGLMSVTQFYAKSVYQQFTFSGNFRPLRAMMISLSYSFLRNGFNNFGAGLTFRPLPPLQFYLLTDYIPLRYGKQYIPIHARSFNLRFGLNFTFGYSHKIKDKPFSWE